MKAYKIYISVLISILFLYSCDLNHVDNYAGPNATIYGGIYDMKTGELVQQDIIRGMQIEYIEQGFDNPEVQYMIVKNDGTYRNNLMFANTYVITPVRGNFVPVDSQRITVKGNTKVDFKVQPYIRILHAKIEKQGTKVIATFNIQQTVSNNVSKIGLFAYEEPNVGSSLNSVSTQIDINGTTDPKTTYTLEIDLGANSGVLQPGKKYYFRVGALIDAPEAKFNYAPAVRLTL